MGFLREGYIFAEYVENNAAPSVLSVSQTAFSRILKHVSNLLPGAPLRTELNHRSFDSEKARHYTRIAVSAIRSKFCAVAVP